MNFMTRIGFVAFLMTGIFFIGGCEEASYSVEHSSSVEVSTDSGIKASSSYKETRSSSTGLFEYKINDANLLDGKTEIYVSLTNHSDKEVVLTNIAIKFAATDEKNKPIREGECGYPNLSVKLPVDKEVYQAFVIEDPNWKAYNESFSISCDFYDVQTNPPIEKATK